MKPTRHEEYLYFDNSLPFLLQTNLERTPKNLSTEMNWHENLEIQLCKDGQGEILLDGTSVPFKKGDFAIASSNVIHYTCTEDRIVYTCLIVDTEFYKRMGIDLSQLKFVCHFQSQALEDMFTKLESAVLEQDPSYRQALSNSIVLGILLELYKNHLEKGSKTIQRQNDFEKVKRAIKYIRNNFSSKITLDQISKEILINKYSLLREFKKITGQTIINYLNNYRCQRAAQIIEGGKGVAEAAYECGFENISFFSRTFKRFMGKLPSKYKNK